MKSCNQGLYRIPYRFRASRMHTLEISWYLEIRGNTDDGRMKIPRIFCRWGAKLGRFHIMKRALWERFMKLPCSNILLKCQRVEWNRRGNQYENLSCFMWHTGDGCIDVEEFSSVCSSFGIDAGEARKAFETLSKVSEKAQNDASSASIFYCAPPPNILFCTMKNVHEM